MGWHTASNKLPGGVLVGAVASGLAITALGAAGTATATCASIDGINNGNGCFSTATSVAIGLGPNTNAHAEGMFDSAIANGLTNTGPQFTTASAVGNFDVASATGPNTVAAAFGTRNLAVAQGSGVQAFAGFFPTDTGNIAFNIANEPTLNPANNVVDAGFGNGNVATNLGGTSSKLSQNFVGAFGNNNVATTVGGSGNEVRTLLNNTSSTAFGLGGTNNSVNPGPGTGQVAGEINQTGKFVTTPPNPHIVS